MKFCVLKLFTICCAKNALHTILLRTPTFSMRSAEKSMGEDLNLMG